MEAQELDDAAPGVVQRRHGLRRFDGHGGAAESGEGSRVETGEGGRGFEIQDDFDSRGGKRVTERREVGLLGRAAD